MEVLSWVDPSLSHRKRLRDGALTNCNLVCSKMAEVVDHCDLVSRCIHFLALAG